MRNIAVIGPLRSGKDSVAAHLRTKAGYVQLAFADALKDDVVAMLDAVDGGGWSVARVNDEKTALRPFLQWYGVWRREQNLDYWVAKVQRAVTLFRTGTLPLIVTDARFLNEIDMLRDNGFTIVQLEMPPALLRPHLRNVAGMSEEQITAALTHPSEQEWRAAKADYIVDSIPGLEGLAAMLDEVEAIARG